MLLPLLGVKGFRGEAGKPCLLRDSHPACTEQLLGILPRMQCFPEGSHTSGVDKLGFIKGPSWMGRY